METINSDYPANYNTNVSQQSFEQKRFESNYASQEAYYSKPLDESMLTHNSKKKKSENQVKFLVEYPSDKVEE